MVDTWERSYFRTLGLRLLYIVPRPWTEKLLPIEISPAPDELVRTLVGRVEILHADEEQALLEKVRAGFESGDALTLSELGRFAEPRLRRVLQMIDGESDLAAYTHRQIARVKCADEIGVYCGR